MVELLDCTLRDGGYYTAWDFEPGLVRTYLAAMAKLPVRHIELGYVNDPMPGYAGEFFFLSPERLRQARAALRPDQSLVVMIDGKGTTPERMAPLFGHLVGLVDMVRITVSPDKLDHGIALARAIKATGMKAGFNVMYLSTFQTQLSKISAAFEVPEVFDSIALVDSYGGCTPERVESLFREMRVALPDKTIGFHGHDNMCLAMANSIAAIAGGADVVDGTLIGMGRGAGNLRLEAMLAYLDGRPGNMPVDYEALSSVVEPFDALQREYGWGTNLPYMISGVNNLPQRDVMDWIGKKRYSVLSIIQALQRQAASETDSRAYPSLQPLANSARPVVVVGGGPSVRRHADAIARFVDRSGALVLFSSSRHIDLCDQLGGEQLLCLPGHDAMRVEVTDNLGRMTAAIVPTPPRVDGCVPAGFPLQVQQAAQLTAAGTGDTIGPVSDVSPLDLALGAVVALATKDCLLVGFDGYETASTAEQSLAREVQSMLDVFRQKYPGTRLRSLTPTFYDIEAFSVYAELAALS